MLYLFIFLLYFGELLFDQLLFLAEIIAYSSCFLQAIDLLGVSSRRLVCSHRTKSTGAMQWGFTGYFACELSLHHLMLLALALVFHILFLLYLVQDLELLKRLSILQLCFGLQHLLLRGSARFRVVIQWIITASRQFVLYYAVLSYRLFWKST